MSRMPKKGNGSQSIVALLTVSMTQQFGSSLVQATEGSTPVHVMTDPDQTWCERRIEVRYATRDWTRVADTLLCEECWQKLQHWFYHVRPVCPRCQGAKSPQAQRCQDCRRAQKRPASRSCEQCGIVLPKWNKRFCGRTCYQNWWWQVRHGTAARGTDEVADER